MVTLQEGKNPRYINSAYIIMAPLDVVRKAYAIIFNKRNQS